MKLRSAEEILQEYEDINRSVFTHPSGIIEMIKTAQQEALEAAELYARSKWNEGVNAVKIRVTDYNDRYFDADHLNPSVCYDNEKSIKLTKPEFKP